MATEEARPPPDAAHDPRLLRAKLNLESGRIGWEELLPHFARGVVVRIAAAEDLVAVAAAFAEDRRDQVASWLHCGAIAPATDEDARHWTATSPQFWAIVVAPWVLVQPISPERAAQREGEEPTTEGAAFSERFLDR